MYTAFLTRISVSILSCVTIDYPRTILIVHRPRGLVLLYKARTDLFRNQPKHYSGMTQRPFYPKGHARNYHARPS